jgi:hypothetical protein
MIGNANPTLAVDNQKLSTSIELVVRLWLMTNVRILVPTQGNVFEVSIPCPEDQSLVEVLNRHLSRPSTYSLSKTDRFPTYFNTIDMRNIANFQVLWTNNLAEHLTVRGSLIYIFHQVSALGCLRSSLSR